MTKPATTTPVHRAPVRLATVGAAVVVVCLMAIVCALDGGASDPPVPVADVVAIASPATTAPPCIHEVCGDRPTRLRCNHWSGSSCDGFDIHYARHCTCDAWGTVATDGGAP